MGAENFYSVPKFRQNGLNPIFCILEENFPTQSTGSSLNFPSGKNLFVHLVARDVKVIFQVMG